MVETKNGKITGIELENCTLYQGVPYASPPVGALRWRAPQPVTPWDGVYRAEHAPKRSWQLHREPGSFPDREFGGEPIYCAEDCLYLNLWVPKQQTKLPVAVWLHGGAFLRGFANEKEYDGTAIARQGVILVTVNYRLGALGYLAHPWLSEEDGTSGNYGLLDQIAALQWVHDHIAAFGGDPENVTVFGQSAGGMSVMALLSSPKAQGLFHRAIIQSAAGLEREISLEQAYAVGERFAAKAGVASLEEMRALPPETVLRLSEEMNAASGQLDFAPISDGQILPKGQPILTQCPVLIGSNKNDLGSDPFSPEPGKMFEAAREFAHRLSDRQSVYLYYFTRQLPGDNAGAFHSAELWYMFGSLRHSWRPFTEADEKLSAQMVCAWTDFIKSGTPGWNAVTAESDNIRVFE